MTTITISSGVASSGVTVSSGDTLVVLSGGEAISSKVLSGGRDVVSSGGIADSGTIAAGGIVFGQGELISNPTDAGEIRGVTVGQIGLAGESYLLVTSGGSLSGVTLDGNFGFYNIIQILGGATATGTVLSGGSGFHGGAALGVQGLAIGTEVQSAGDQQVDLGGRARGTIVQSGGQEYLDGGFTSGSTILSGGLQYVLAGEAIGDIISGGRVKVSISRTKGYIGKVVSTVVESNGRLIVGARPSGVKSSGQMAVDTTVSSGGFEVVSSGGLAAHTTVDRGGYEVVSYGGTASKTTLSHGTLRVLAGGAALGTVAGGFSISGGNETILSGGSATGTLLLSHGYEFDYGEASGTVIRSGGHEEVERGGTTSGSVVSNGGREIVSSGGLAIAASLFNGGTLIVSSGGSISGGLTIHAGQATIGGAMAAGQTVRFAGTVGTLRVDNLAAFGAAISGFGGPTERIDLGGFAFAGSETTTWAQTGTSGTLTVHDGATSGSLTLVGTYATGDFALSTDGHGGTLIREPTILAALPATTRFTQAVAGLEGGRFAASAAAVHGGGSALIGASPLVGVATSGR
jgi:autotransporter passenger strand-loop-strand repeat protein